MNKYRKLLSDTGVLGIGKFISKAMVFLMMPLYTACLSPEEYGIADIISQTSNLIIPVACAGICDGIFRFTLDGDAHKPTVFKTSVILTLISGGVFLALSPLLLFINFLNSYAWLVAAYVTCSNFHSLCAQYVRANDRPRLFALQGIINTGLVIILNIFFLPALHLGVRGYVLSIIIADFVTGIFLVLHAKLYSEMRTGKFSPELAKRLLKYSVPMIPTTIFWWITDVSDRYFVVNMCGEEANGIYSAANKIPTLIILLCSVFYEAWQFSAVKDAGEKTKSEFFGKIYRYYSGLIFAGGAAIVFLSRIFARILFAKNYSGVTEFIPTLTLAAVFSALTTFMGSVYLVKKKSVLSLLTSMLGAGLNILLNFCLIPRIAARGAAIATVASYFAAFAVRTITAQKHIKFRVGYCATALNIVLLAVETILAVHVRSHWYLYVGIAALSVVCVNGRALKDFAVDTVGELRGKKEPGDAPR